MVMRRVWAIFAIAAVLPLAACTSSSKTKTPVTGTATTATTFTATTTTAVPTPSTRAAPASTAAPNTPVTTGSYGFLVPTGWAEQPLTNYGGPVSNAHFYEPGSRSSILYVISGASQASSTTQMER